MKSIKKIALALIVVVLTFSSCTKEDCIKGNGEIITESFKLEEFSKVYSYIDAKINISQGDTQSVSVKGDSNIIKLLKRQIIDNSWVINRGNDECVKDYKLEITIIVKDLGAVGSAGSGTIEVNDFINQESLEIESLGSANIALKSFKDTKTVIATTIGSGNIIFKGANFSSVANITSKIGGSGDIIFDDSVDFSSLKTAEIKINGSGNYKGFFAKSEGYVVKSNGSGNCEIHVINDLDVAINGSGDVSYKGNPEVTKAINGSGELIRVN